MNESLEAPGAGYEISNTREAGVAQFGALCVRGSPLAAREVLLITTRQTKRWTIPKGWPIKGRKPYQVAEQEAWEEAGVIGRAHKRPIGNYDYIKKLDSGEQVRATVEVHVLDVRRSKRKFPERRERDLAWVAVEEAARLVAEPGLEKLIRRFGEASSN